MANPHRLDPGGVSGGTIVAAVADHPSFRWVNFELFTREKQRRRVGLELAVFSRDEDLEVQAVLGQDGCHACAAIARDERGLEIVLADPGYERVAARIEDRVACGTLFVLV